jgi:hypothetical protein
VAQGRAAQLLAAALCFGAMTRGFSVVRLLLASTVITLLAIAALSAPAGLLASLPYLLPTVLLLLALARRRYPCERVLLAFIGRKRQRRRSTRAPHRPRPRASVPRGGRLIACSLAVRPPPPSRAVRFTH